MLRLQKVLASRSSTLREFINTYRRYMLIDYSVYMNETWWLLLHKFIVPFLELLPGVLTKPWLKYST